MHLFDRIPEQLFSVLASKNKRIYLDALFVVKRGFQYELNLTRSELVVMLMGELEEQILELVEEEGEETPELTRADLSGRANFLIRKLVETKWLRTEMRTEDFEHLISLPDYASTLLNALNELTEEKEAEYNGYVVSSYNNLKAVDHERDEYALQALNRALKDTEELTELLKKQYHNIGRYHQRTLELMEVNPLLASHFDDFQAKVVEDFLHPMKTFDSVPRFKGPILEILHRWHDDEGMLKLLMEQGKTARSLTDEEAKDEVLGTIGRMMDLYEELPRLISDIDRRHNGYTRASIEKIQYLIHRDQSIKGKLVEVLQAMGEGRLKSEEVTDEIRAFSQGYLEPGSLYNRSKMKRTREIKAKPVTSMDPKEKEKALRRFIHQLEGNYGKQAVINEMLKYLEEGSKDASELPLENSKDLTRLLLASLYGGQRSTPFTTEYSKERHETEKFRVPLNRFSRREES